MLSLSLLLAIGMLWIVLKILITMIELPFRILGFIFGGTMSAIFWIVFAILLFGAIV